MKHVVRILLVLVGVLVVAVIAGRLYLRSQRVVNQVTTQLEEIYGGPVRVAEVDVGLGGTALGGFELFEDGADKSQEPWLKVRSLGTDINVFDLLSGNTTPGEVTLSGAAVTLRFDHRGRLVTRFPGARKPAPEGDRVGTLPRIELKESQVTFRRAGTPDLVIQDVNATLDRQGERVVLRGQAHNPQWGRWTLHGEFGTDASRPEVEFRTEGRVEVTRGMLEGLPFVPAAVWRAVEIDRGNTSLRVALRYDLEAKAAHYRVEMDPQDTALHVPAIDLRATGARGGLVIDDARVKLQDVRGKAYHGTLSTDADLDFGGSVTRLSFPRVHADRLDVSALPASWKFPKQIRGRLTGHAKLQVTIVPGHATPAAAAASVSTVGVSPLAGSLFQAATTLAAPVPSTVTTRGQGKGQIAEATVAGQKAEELTIELHAVPGGFRFGSKPTSVSDAGGIQANSFALALLPSVAQEPPAANATAFPADVANALAGGVDQVLRGVLAVGGRVVGVLPEKITYTPPKPEDPPNYLEINLRMKQVNLAEFVKGLGVQLPFDVAGKLTFQVKAALPIDRPGDLKLYRINGTARVTNFELAGVTLDEVETDLAYADGVLRMPSLLGKVGEGTVKGTGEFQLVPMGDLAFDVTLDRVPVSEMAKIVDAGDDVRGAVSGRLTASVPGQEARKLAAWQAKGTVTSKQLVVFGLAFQDATAGVNLAKGGLALADLRAALEGAPVSGAAKVRLSGTYPVEGNLVVKGGSLATLRRLAPEWRPPVELGGDFSARADVRGTLRPFKVEASGTAAAAEVRVSDFRVRDARFRWAVEDDRLHVTDARAVLYGGDAAGTAVVPLAPKADGSVALDVKGVDVAALSKDLPKLPVRLAGQVRGTLKGTIAPADAKAERAASFNLSLAAPKLRVQGVPAEELQGAIDYRAGVIDYRLEGKSLGGTFELEGQVPPAGKAAPKAKQGRLQVRRVRLGQLLRSLNLQGDAADLRGLLDMEVNFRHEGPDRLPVGTGRVRVSNLRWKQTTIASSLQGDLVLDEDELRLRGLSGTFAQGSVRAQLAYRPRQPERSFVSVTLENVEASQALGPWLGETVEGPMRLWVRGRLGREWSGSGELTMDRGKVYNVEVTQARVPFTWRYAPATGVAQLESPEFGAHVARGRATGRLSLRHDYSLGLDGQLRWTGVDVQAFLRQAFGVNQVGSGQMAGRFDFAGRDVRSIDDLTGTLDASFGQTQAFRLPVFQQITPFLRLGPSTTFEKGNLKARLDRGLLRVQRLGLESSNLFVFAEGTVTTSGRLDLNVVANTGPLGLDLARLRLLGGGRVTSAPLPLVLLRRANEFLVNRVVYLTVTGTVRSPVIRVRPFATLTQEAARFLLTPAGVPLP